jgi:hypothetical protein
LCEFRNRITGGREGALGHDSPFVVQTRTPGGLHSPSRCQRKSDNRSPPLRLL